MIVNYTHQYILNLEVKEWIGPLEDKPEEESIIKVAEAQLERIRHLIEEWFSSELIGDWIYISALYCQSMVNQLKSDFVVKGQYQLKTLLKNIPDKIISNM